MTKISNISKLIRMLIVFITLLHIASFVSHLYDDRPTGIERVVPSTSETTLTSTAGITESWQEFSQALEQEGFNSIAILASVDIAFYSFIYFLVFQLFGLFQQGKIFTQQNINCIKSIGRCLLAWVVISIIYPAIVTLIIRVSGTSDSLALYFSIGSTELVNLLSGLIIYAFAWVINEAIEIKQEQELVI